MDDQMRLYLEAYSENFTTDDLIRVLHNPLRDYENEFVDGAIVDIGCGQTTFLLDYINTNRRLIGIDNDQYQLDFLKNRLDALPITNANIELLNLTLLSDNLPSEAYSVVFLANILHFFNLAQCQEIISQLKLNLASGSLIYVWAHSDKYYRNDPSDQKTMNISRIILHYRIWMAYSSHQALKGYYIQKQNVFFQKRKCGRRRDGSKNILTT
jgi:SAM-dependent methyltransferase